MTDFLCQFYTHPIAWSDGPGWTLAILAAAVAAPGVGALCSRLRGGGR